MTNTILEVKGLTKHYQQSRGIMNAILGRPQKQVYAVNDVTLSLRKGETLGLVGESGCGKTTLSRTILRLYESSEGTIVFEGKDISSLDSHAMRKVRKDMQMVFQDPYSSLNPKMTVREMLAEAIRFHHIYEDKNEIREYIDYLLDRVGLNPGDADKYPKSFSGGQRQRICIARAIAVKPKLLIADEPVSALDVSVQAHILNLLKDLQQEFQLAMIFISHDLSVVKYISHRVAVMYLGRIVEIGEPNDVFERPTHPYTKALLSSIPIVDTTKKRERLTLEGDPPSPFEVHRGCAFTSRCPKRMEICDTTLPVLESVADAHQAACHFK